jgi:hypothetical protein
VPGRFVVPLRVKHIGRWLVLSLLVAGVAWSGALTVRHLAARAGSVAGTLGLKSRPGSWTLPASKLAEPEPPADRLARGCRVLGIAAALAMVAFALTAMLRSSRPPIVALSRSKPFLAAAAACVPVLYLGTVFCQRTPSPSLPVLGFLAAGLLVLPLGAYLRNRSRRTEADEYVRSRGARLAPRVNTRLPVRRRAMPSAAQG